MKAHKIISANRPYILLCVLAILVVMPLLEVNAQGTEIITANDTILFDVHPDEEEYKILTEFYQEMNGKNWKKNTRWLQGKTSDAMAKWYGVVVRHGDVSEIHLDSNNLQGTIPKKLYNLAGLVHVSFDGNNLPEIQEVARVLEDAANGVGLETPVNTMLTTEVATPLTFARNLPVWGLAVDGNKLQKIDWRPGTDVATELPNSSTSGLGSSGVAIDECGQLAFYVLHAGGDGQNRLHIFSADGTRLTNEIPGNVKQGLSSTNGNMELQVVRVPNTADEWFIIYSAYQAPCLSYPGGSVYCPARVVYARVKYNQAEGLIMTAGQREVSISNKRFIQGKAVSRTVNGLDQKQYLYLAARSGNTLRVHRYIITDVGINFGTESAGTIPALNWQGSISGSSIELSPDEKKLAISNRNALSDAADIIVFDLSRFNDSDYHGNIIKVPSLVVYGTKAVTIGSLGGCYLNIKNKLSQIEFSPSGRYLYALNGGYPALTSRMPYDTYLLQIDLESGTGQGDYVVRMRVQGGAGSVFGCTGNGDYGSTNFLQQIQSSYNGRLYFTKQNSSTLFVIPHPDDPMPHSLTPHVVDLSTPYAPNLQMANGAKVLYLPENIDGFDYLKQGGAAQFTLDNELFGRETPLTLTLDAFDDTNTNAYTYQVAWGDGVGETFTAQTTSHSYAEKGDYTVTVTAMNQQMCASAWSRNVKVLTCAAIAGVSLEVKQYLCATRLSVTRVDDCMTTYNWDLGDGVAYTGRTLMHAFSPGEHLVKVNARYNCGRCQDDLPLETTVVVTAPNPELETHEILVGTDQRLEVINSAATTFSETWPLEDPDQVLGAMNPFISGAQGMWRSEGTFLYNTPRSFSAPVAVHTDGTYTLEHFNWAQAHLEAIPKWVKASTVTRYNAFGFGLESRDVQGIYSGALYDHHGHLQTAQGVNMRHDEMGFTSFEGFTGEPAGNFIFSNKALPEYKEYKVSGANEYIAVVEAPLADIADADRADVLASWRTEPSWFPLRTRTRYMADVKIVCKLPHPDPNRPDLSLIVLEEAPYGGVWKGLIRIKNTIVPVVIADIDNTVAHTGKSSLKIMADKTFEQKLFRLEAGKEYFVSAWVSVGSTTAPTAPKLANRLGIDVTLKNDQRTTVATTLLVPEGQVIEGWQQVKGTFTCPQNDLVLSLRFRRGEAATAWYDDIRLYPRNGNMKSYVYNMDDFRLRAVLDEENFASVFYYDKEGNLFLTKKETEEGIKTISENVSYQAAKPNQQE